MKFISVIVLSVAALTTATNDKEDHHHKHECYGFEECPKRWEYPVPYNQPSKYKVHYNSFHNNGEFPEDFAWGVGTAAYQIEGAYNEGGRGASIWDTFTGADTVGMPGSVCKKSPCPINSQQGVKGATGNVANNHYHNWKNDVEYMAAMGVPEYRFSFAWPRLIPTGNIADGVNPEGVQFYHNLLDELHKHNIKPVVTLYHWDLPQGLFSQGLADPPQPVCDDNYKQGWYECQMVDGKVEPKPMNETDIIGHFKDYAELVFNEFGDKVVEYATFNEAWTFTHLASGSGKAPSVYAYRDASIWPYIAGHNVIRSHLEAVKSFRALQKEGKLKNSRIGIVNNCDWRDPVSQKPEDVAASMREVEAWLGWYADPIYGVDGKHDYPGSMKNLVGANLPTFTDEEKAELKENVPDYFGLNHYGTAQIANCANYTCDGDLKQGPLTWHTTSSPDYANGDGKATTQILVENLMTGQSTWLFGAGWGLRKLLNYVDNRYGSPDIFITENGWSEQADSVMQGKYDTGRVIFYNNYLKAIHKAITIDKVKVKGYYAWSLMDNFEWERGYLERFGTSFNEFNFCHEVDFNNPNCDPNAPTPETPLYDFNTGNITGTCGNECLGYVTSIPSPQHAINQTRHPKNSLLWLSQVWKKNGLVPSADILSGVDGAVDYCFGNEQEYTPYYGYTAQCSPTKKKTELFQGV